MIKTAEQNKIITWKPSFISVHSFFSLKCSQSAETIELCVLSLLCKTAQMELMNRKQALSVLQYNIVCLKAARGIFFQNWMN